MAPEQVLGAPRDEGPWTDLYALGCLAFRLACGKAPFRGPAKEIAYAHLHRPPPALYAQLAVPDEFADWIGVLLEKEPRRRFRCAADAAWALARMVDTVESSGTRPIPEPPRSDPDAVTSIASPPSMTARGEAAEDGGIDVVVDEASPVHHEAPPLPATWRSALPAAAAPRLPDTGLGVFGLRDVPLVGREAERDALWSELGRVHEGGARLVLLEGPSGCGKSRLARWLSERAHEVGAAEVHRVLPKEDGLDEGALAQMLARAFRTEGLEFAAALPRVRAALATQGQDDDAEARALAALVAPSGAPVPVGGTAERHAIARRFLSREASRRPALVWIDDAQWSEDALAFARHALDAAEGARVLFVATVRSDVPTSAAALLATLRARPDVVPLSVGPLPTEYRAALVRELLGLEGELAAAVEERTAGSPLFAGQLVGDWVQRGLLEPTVHGFRLREGAHAVVPRDVGAVWRERIEGLLEAWPAEHGVALELAAVLGLAVEPSLWEGACAAAGVAAPWVLVDRLLDARLATCDERGPRAGWAFAHAMLREGIVERAREGGRLAPHHARCADALAARPDGSPARLGRHLRAAGDEARAIAPLLRAARAHGDVGDVSLTRLLLRECEEAMRAAGVPESDARWAEVWTLAAVHADGTDETHALAERVIVAAERHGWTKVVAEARLAQARALVKQAQPDRAEALCRAALATYEALGDQKGAWLALHWQGIAEIERGDAEASRRVHERALRTAQAIGDDRTLADSHYELGLALRPQPDQGRPHLEACLAINERMGRGLGTANALLGLGELDRDAGAFHESEDKYRRALAIYERIGSSNGLIARLNLGLAMLAQGRWADARRTLEAARAPLERAGWTSMLACAHVEIGAACIGMGDWAGRDEHFSRAQALLAEGRVADLDLGWAATLAGDLAARAGEPARAREAWELARHQWSALGRSADVDAVDGKLAGLSAATAGGASA
jgi:tetratricopeptide (TPR) repeat protein